MTFTEASEINAQQTSGTCGTWSYAVKTGSSYGNDLTVEAGKATGLTQRVGGLAAD